MICTSTAENSCAKINSLSLIKGNSQSEILGRSSSEGIIVDFDEKENDIKNLIEAGAEMVGGGAGVAIGFLFSGPAGAVAGGAIGPVITRALICTVDDIQKRFLSQREQNRIGAVLIYAARKYQDNIAKGMVVRTDGFFKESLNERSDGKEIFEGVLLAAKGEHEEKKLLFFANLLINIAFDPTIDRAQANFLIKLSETITFRQMCLLSVYADHDRLNHMRKCLSNKEFPYPDAKRYSLRQEAIDLGSQGLLRTGCKLAFQETEGGFPIRTMHDLFYSDDVQVVELGHDLYRLMELGKIDEGELKPIISLIYNTQFEEF